MPLRTQGYCGVGKGLSGLHWVWCNGRGPQLEWTHGGRQVFPKRKENTSICSRLHESGSAPAQRSPGSLPRAPQLPIRVPTAWIPHQHPKPTQFTTVDLANNYAAQLKKKGYKGYVRKGSKGYSVLVGDYATKSEAQSVCAKLRKSEKNDSYVISL